MIYHVYWFMYVETFLHPYDKSLSIRMDDLFDMSLDLFASYVIRTSCTFILLWNSLFFIDVFLFGLRSKKNTDLQQWVWKCSLDHLFYICLLIDTVYFHILTIVNTAEMKLVMQIDFWHIGSYGNLEEPPYYFLKWRYYFTISSKMHKGSLFFTFSTTLVISCFSSNSYNRCKMISHCSVDLHFWDDHRYWVFKNISSAHSQLFFEKYLLSSIAQFLISLFIFLLLNFWVPYLFWIIAI